MKITLPNQHSYAEMAASDCAINGKAHAAGTRVRFERGVVYEVDDATGERLLAIPARWGKPVFVKAEGVSDPDAKARALAAVEAFAADPGLLAKFEAFLASGATAPAVADVSPPKAASGAKAEPKAEEKAEEPAPVAEPADEKAETKAPAKPKKNLADLKK